MTLELDLSISKVSQVKLLDRGRVIDQLTGSNTLELIDQILVKNNLKLADLDGVESFPGPGSYTGLKVGAAIANALNFALGKKSRVRPIFEAKT